MLLSFLIESNIIKSEIKCCILCAQVRQTYNIKVACDVLYFWRDFFRSLDRFSVGRQNGTSSIDANQNMHSVATWASAKNLTALPNSYPCVDEDTNISNSNRWTCGTKKHRRTEAKEETENYNLWSRARDNTAQ